MHAAQGGELSPGSRRTGRARLRNTVRHRRPRASSSVRGLEVGTGSSAGLIRSSTTLPLPSRSPPAVHERVGSDRVGSTVVSSGIVQPCGKLPRGNLRRGLKIWRVLHESCSWRPQSPGEGRALSPDSCPATLLLANARLKTHATVAHDVKGALQWMTGAHGNG